MPQELERMAKLAAKPPLEEEMAHKYDPGSWDADGYPTTDKDRTPLSDKVKGSVEWLSDRTQLRHRICSTC